MAGTRIAAFVSRAAGVGVLVFCFSGAALALAPDEEAETGPPPKPASCLSGPRGTAPKGERWYYRVERGTKRHCWYTRGEEGRRTAERAPPRLAEAPTRIEKTAEPPKPPVEILKVTEAPAPAPLQLSVANARAEANISVVPPQQAAPAPAMTPPPAPPAPPERPNWKLADRWANDSSANAQPAPAVQEIARAIQPRVAQATVQPAMTPPRMPPPKPEPIVEIEESQPSEWADVTAAALALLGIVTIVVAIIVLRRKPEEEEWSFGRRTAAHLRPRLHLADREDDDEQSNWRAPQFDVAQIPRPHPRISRRQA